MLIRVRATAINRLDCQQRKGVAMPPPGVTEVLGLECAGEVVASGAGVRFAPGDRVMALLPGGGFAQFACVAAETVMRVPPHLSFAQAASVPEAWLTAYQLVVLLAGVRPGDVVLVHAAASGVGLAAVQLVASLGATPLVTVGSSAKLELCLAHGAAGGAVRSQTHYISRLLGRRP